MPEEDIQYNVRLNEAELSDQLERIRSQIDLTMGSLASSNSEIPLASDLINTSDGFSGMSSDIPVGLPEDSPIPIGMSQDQGMWGGISAAFDDAAQSTQLGLSKFTDDMRRIGLLSQPQYPQFGMQRRNNPQQGPVGFWDNAKSLISPSWGSFDPNRGGMSSADFHREAVDNFAGSFAGPLANNIGTLTGVSIGASIGGWGGAMTGLAIGGAFDISSELLASYGKEQLQMSSGLKRIADDSFGGISTGDAIDMAKVVQDRVYSLEGRIHDYSMESVQENITGFADAGGFNNDVNAEEMKETLQGVVENARQFANEMNMAQEDAVQVMADLKRNMVSKTSEMGALGADIGRTADQLNMDPGALMSFGTQGMEMFRGTGATSTQGFNMAIEARLQTERMMQADPTTRQLVQQAGGAEQFALGRAESASRFMQSGQGMIATTAILGGMEGGIESMGGMLNHSAEYLTRKPGNIFSFYANQGRLNASLGFENQQALQVMMAHTQAKAAGFTNSEGEIGDEQLLGMMAKWQKMSAPEARATLAGFRENARLPSDVEEAKKQMNNMQSFIDENDTSYWSRVGGRIDKTFSMPDFEWANNALHGTVGFFKDAGQSMGDYMAGQGRHEGLDSSQEAATRARSFRGTDMHKKIVEEAENYSQEERRQIIDRDLKERFGGPTIGLNGAIDRLSKNRDLEKDQLQEIAYGLGKEGAWSFIREVDEQGYNTEDLEGISMLAKVSEGTKVDDGDINKAGKIDSSELEGSLKEKLNQAMQQVSGTNFSEGTESEQYAVYKHLRVTDAIDDSNDKMISRAKHSFNMSKSKMKSNALEEEITIGRGKLNERIVSDLIPGANFGNSTQIKDQETLETLAKDIITNGVDNVNAEDYEGLEAKEIPYLQEQIRDTKLGRDLIAKDKELDTYEARLEARKDVGGMINDQISDSLYLETMSTEPAIEGRMDNLLANTNDDQLYTLLDSFSNSEEMVEKLKEKDVTAMRKVEGALNEEFDAKMGEINRKILKKSFMEQTGGDPSKMFQNYGEYVKEAVFSSLDTIIKPGEGIKTIEGGKENTKPPEDLEPRSNVFGIW